jgi:predicted dehydrogenase
VGTVAMDIPRRFFYEKELDFRVSRSYGPGRYDSAYEQKGIDYPIGYVRWTETRNMEAFLKLLADHKLDLHSLITHRFPIARANSAYELITGNTREPFLGVLIEYPHTADLDRTLKMTGARRTASGNQLRIGLLGAGNFATSTLLPALKRIAGVEMIAVGAANGSHAHHAARKFGFRSCATDEREILHDQNVNAVIICTRHHLHAQQVIAALKLDKHVLCEKPLCLNETELSEIVAVREEINGGARLSDRPTPPLIMVGFNRRFAPLALRLKTFLREANEPLALHYRINAGFLPADHWLNDPQQGGGRILGEVCHFVDFLCFLTGAAPVEVETRALPNPVQYSNDNVVCSLRFTDGSQGSISYLANGDRSYSKERVEVFGGGAVAVLEDFRRLELVRNGKKRVLRSFLRQDKGHRGELEAFANAIQSGAESPIPFREIVATMRATFALEQSRCLGQPISIPAAELLMQPSMEKDRNEKDFSRKAQGFDQAS